jgi:hypothetical protein
LRKQEKKDKKTRQKDKAVFSKTKLISARAKQDKDKSKDIVFEISRLCSFKDKSKTLSWKQPGQ